MERYTAYTIWEQTLRVGTHSLKGLVLWSKVDMYSLKGHRVERVRQNGNKGGVEKRKKRSKSYGTVMILVALFLNHYKAPPFKT